MRNRVQSNIRMKAEKHTLQVSKHVLNAAIVARSPVASSKPVKVNGFVFPLTSMDDIERLEEVVRADFAIREQYVEYLALRKPSSVDVSNFFSYLFTDDALINYNFSGANNVGDQKMPMRNYSIFTDCMIDLFKITSRRIVLHKPKVENEQQQRFESSGDQGELKYSFLTSRKGGVHLVHENFIYRSNMRRSGPNKQILYWECIHNRSEKCRGRVKSVGDYLYISNGNGMGWKSNTTIIRTFFEFSAHKIRDIYA
ncbi:conserved hypothetical protein [Culex quinquefasciatus]|uniref:Uncharacterized protein n=1 Tax=Culex quinquefasciatus TaxID=7176 RepID=B0W390_CULQU|nr:conserved hypothetical protein [Culex quinquefasciatus]|eukprot:XP_001843174.1 conserved hypothetical protein [Culex quinquefasciatus]